MSLGKDSGLDNEGFNTVLLLKRSVRGEYVEERRHLNMFYVNYVFELNFFLLQSLLLKKLFAHCCAEKSPSNELCLPAERGRKKSKEAAHKLEATTPDLHLICNLNRLGCLSITRPWSLDRSAR